MDIFGGAAFVGQFRHSVDAKGRLTIPSKWRIDAQDGQDAYLALPGSDGVIRVYPPQMIARLTEKAASISMGNKVAQNALATVMSIAHSFSCDKNGRINLNELLLKHSGIKKEAVLLGMISRFDIYSPGAFEEFQKTVTQKRVDESFDALAQLDF